MIETPEDHLQFVLEVRKRPDVVALENEYKQLLTTRLYPLKQSNITNIFGPPLLTSGSMFSTGTGDATNTTDAPARSRPVDIVPPFLAPYGLGVIGQFSTNPALNKDHKDLYAVGKVGYLEILYPSDDERIGTAVLLGRADEHFVPLQTAADYSRRLDWDKTNFAQIKDWLNQHLPKCLDLGEVEVSESAPSRVSLGHDKTCLIKTQIIHSPNATNDSFFVTLLLDLPAEAVKGLSDEDRFKRQQLAKKSVDRPNQAIGFLFDGEAFRLTPKLKK